MYIDTHTHLTDKRYEGESDNIAKSLNKEGILFVINIGYDAESSYNSVLLTEKYDSVYASVAVHPHDSGKAKAEDYETFRKYSLNQKVVAIGETGLDYYYDTNPPRKVQKKVFAEHLELANSLKLPVIIHIRDAFEDAYNILKEIKPHYGGVLHCFSGSSEMAKRFLDTGLFISFAGAVTFKNARGLIDAVKTVPLDRILTETDCPYLTPEPHRGKLNYPSYVKHIADKIAQIKEISVQELNENVLNNALKLFTRIKI